MGKNRVFFSEQGRGKCLGDSHFRQVTATAMWIWGARVKNGGREPTESDDECQLQGVHNENEALLMKATWTGETARR